MRLRRRSIQDIEDRRGQGGGGGGFGIGGGGGGRGLPIPASLGGGGIVAVLIFLALQFFGGGGGGGLPSGLDGVGGQPAVDPGTSVDLTNDGDMVQFMNDVLGDANDLWADTFKRAGREYPRATLVLFSGNTVSGCGAATSATGPFYCPADQKVYLDTDFFADLSKRFGAPGDFAQAYVIAHEVGHHVQTVTGIEGQVRQLQQQAGSQDEVNGLSVKMELQADCLSGVWAQSVYEEGALDPGDIEEGLNAAAAVGDDRIQANAGVTVDPETWTHGSSEQRMQWFQTGYRSGDPAACDTFGS